MMMVMATQTKKKLKRNTTVKTMMAMVETARSRSIYETGRARRLNEEKGGRGRASGRGRGSRGQGVGVGAPCLSPEQLHVVSRESFIEAARADSPMRRRGRFHGAV